MLHNWPWWLEGEKYLWELIEDLAAFAVVGRHKVEVHNTLSHFEILHGGLSRGGDG